ncbi:MAG: radical SAM protein [Nanoarchaeota archaeon]|nr:radical SAM protein [Nanoarchaeota archaeon]
MKVLFISKPFNIEPLGVMYLSSSLKKQGHSTDLVLTTENLENKVEEFSPDILAYSLITGDHQFFDNTNRQLKKYDKFSIAGGPHPTFFPEWFKDSSFDAINIGEGELSFSELCNKLEKKQDITNIQNLWVKKDNKIYSNPPRNLIANLDEISFPDRELVFKYPNIGDGPIKHFIASRGCPFNCSYCFNASYSEIYQDKGKRVRFRSVDNLLDEVKQVVEESPTKFIYFQDDTFILNKEWVKEFSEKYKQKINLPFHSHLRANLVNDEIINSLSDAGCYSVHIASEAGSDYVRRNILNRNMTNEQIIDSVKKLKEKGIKVMLQNIIGLPFTSLEDDLETLELNRQCQPNYSWVSLFQPYPKTELGERCVKEGVYKGDFSDIGNNFFDQSVIEIPNKNERVNLQKLFALAVKYPEVYTQERLIELLEIPNKEVNETYSRMYKNFRKTADKELYGFDL